MDNLEKAIQACNEDVKMKEGVELVYKQMKEEGLLAEDPTTGKMEKKKLMNIMMQLRKICNHPYLLDNPDQRLESKKDKEAMIEKSGKLKALEELLISLGFESAMNQNSFINSSSYENKLLIFTQMTKWQHAIVIQG